MSICADNELDSMKVDSEYTEFLQRILARRTIQCTGCKRDNFKSRGGLASHQRKCKIYQDQSSAMWAKIRQRKERNKALKKAQRKAQAQVQAKDAVERKEDPAHTELPAKVSASRIYGPPRPRKGALPSLAPAPEPAAPDPHKEGLRPRGLPRAKASYRYFHD